MFWRLPGGMLVLVLATAVGGADEPDPRRPAAIETQGVPAVPAALVERLAQYQNVRAAGFAGWAPDGQGMLVRTRFGNSLQLHRVYQPGGRREQITFFDEPASGRFLPAAQDGALLLSLSAGGNENDQLYFFDPASYRTRRLTDGVSRNGLGPITDDGRRMIVSSNRRNGRDTDLYLANPRQPDSLQMLLQVEKEFWNATDWSPDGERLLLVKYVSINESYPALLNVATKERTEIPVPESRPGEKFAIGALAFAADGKSVLLATDAGGEFRRLARVELATGKHEWLTSDLPHDVTELEVDPRSGRVACALNADGATRLLLLEPAAAGFARRELKLPLGIASSLEFSPDGKQLGLTLARPDAPADAYSLDLASGALTRWTFSEVGGLNPATFVTPARIEFPSFDKRQIPAWLYRPRAARGKAPVLIVIHGGPESQAQPFFSGGTQFYVNELGLAVILPNVRGSSGYGKTYLQLDNGVLREDSVKDIGALLDWIARQDDLDASRIAVMGGSYGGYMTLATLVNFGDRLAAGIDVVGIANFNTFLATTAAYRQDLRRVEYGDERDPAIKAFFERISPANRADQIRAPLLVVHGRNDPRVPFGEAEQIAAQVRRQGQPVWTVYAANEGHGFAKKDNADYLRAVETLFLQQFLKLPSLAGAEP